MSSGVGPDIDASVTGEVTSADGTTIAYWKIGRGAGVILLHGAGQSSENLSKLAFGLADTFTVYVLDRRGHGRNRRGDFRGLRTEIEDLSAILDLSSATRVFGLSSGAVVAIETARVRPDIRKLALYEPPLSFDGVRPDAWAPTYQRELASGRPGTALVTVLKATADRTALIRFVPSFLLAGPLNFVIKLTANRPPPPGTMSISELVESVNYDIRTVGDAAGPLERFATLSCDVFLLGGSKSARDLTDSLNGLAKVLPGAKRITIRGVGHTAPDNSHQPDRVAAELRPFFDEP
jgi:pimeloyl-ACP methyl ester carboxylesterase